MSYSKTPTLLAISNIYKLSNDDLYSIRQKFKSREHFVNNIPKYTINEDFDSVVEVEYYLQFIGEVEENKSNPKYYYLFDLHPIDPLLDEEINQGGIDEILNFSKYFNLKRPKFIDIINKFPALTISDYDKISIPTYNYLIVDLIYICSGDWYVECDLEIEITKYLNNNFKLIEYDEQEIYDGNREGI